jgi:hypothetical protein
MLVEKDWFAVMTETQDHSQQERAADDCDLSQKQEKLPGCEVQVE